MELNRSAQPRLGRHSKIALFLLCALGLVLMFVSMIRQSLAHADQSCRLTVPHSSIDPMVFPAKEGSQALDAAIVENAEPALIVRVLHEQGGFSIPHGTACAELERGPVYSRVTVTEGPFAGQSVWAPTLHTAGQ